MHPNSTGAKVLSALTPYKVKPAGKDKYRSNSPLRADSDSGNAFSLEIDPDGEHGAYYDFVTEAKGSLYDLARHLRIELPQKEIPTTKRQYATLDDYATAHGLPVSILERLKWVVLTYQGRPAIRFPTTTGARYRFMDGNKPTFKSPSGYKRSWYRLKTAIKLAQEQGTALVLCNGEISTIAGQYRHIPATAVTGSGEKPIPPTLLDELRGAWDGDILIGMDCDKAGRKSAQAIKEQLIAVGYKARSVDFGLGKGGDLADYIMLHDDSPTLIYTLPDAPPPPPDDPANPGSELPPRPGQFRNTDVGNAQRLVARHGRDLHFCHVWNKWLVWDGKRWLIDETAQIMRIGKETVQHIYHEASEEQDPRQRKSLGKHALASESNGKLKSMIEQAESEPGIPVQPGELDTQSWLLNCSNGTVDLRTGDLLSHNRDHLITKLCPVEYDPEARCPNWLAFLNRVMNGNMGLIAYLQRAIGYILTGDTSEQCLWFLYGIGANGKSTFMETLRAMLGDYAQQTPTESLMIKDHPGISNDIARLRGARFVAATETEEGQRLAEVLIKQLTGNDTIVARFLHAEFFEFTPTFKIFIAGNHKPTIRGTDYGIWRRLQLVPFTVTIPAAERDPKLARKLQQELPGILAWAVAGCQEWQAVGLFPPLEVLAATEGYKAEMDTLALFMGEMTITGPNFHTSAADMYKSYTQWCQAAGETPSSQKKLGQRLSERGFKSEHQNFGNVWVGIGLTRKPDPPMKDQ